MFGGKTQSAQRPTALGTMLQASTYGMTIPQIYGTTLATILAIWAQNLRQGGCGKKGKKKGVECFAENMDFLIGANPLECALQVWENTTKYPLDFLTYRVAPGAGVKSVTIPDPHFYKLIAVTAELSLVTPITFDCFGAPGPIVFSDGGGNGSANASIVANSPIFTPGSGAYGGVTPSVAVPFPGGGSLQGPGFFVVGRIRGSGLSVWQGVGGGAMFATQASDAGICFPSASSVLTQDSLVGECSCTGGASGSQSPGVTQQFGCGGLRQNLWTDGSGQLPGNVQTSNVDLAFDMETLSFSIGNFSSFVFTSCAWTGSGPIGPCTLNGMTFPGPGTGPLYQDGHNLGDEGGGQIFLMQFLPTGSIGTSLFVAVVSGAQPVGGLGFRPIAPGWQFAQLGTNIVVFFAYAESGGTPAGASLWNAAQHGPDLINPNYVRQSNYKWDPNTDGATIDISDIQSANPPGFPEWTWNGFLDFYYAALSDEIGHKVPLDELKLTFEPQLGDGAEYVSPYENEQIIYPGYAGVGSPDMDLGAGGGLPSIRLETKGSFAKIAPRGDAEFADMIEDIFKSGVLQLGAQLGMIQRGVNANELPGPVQKNFLQYNPDAAITVPFRSANAAGDLLVAFARTTSGTPAISDTTGNTWNPLYNTGNKGVWQATALAADPGNAVDFGTAEEGYVLEMDPGSTALNAQDVNSGTGSGPMTGSIAVTNNQGPTYILGIYMDDSATAGAVPPQWNQNLFSRAQTKYTQAFYRIVSAAGTYAVSIPRTGSGNWTLVLLAFCQSQPVPYPAALGKILDEDTLNNVRAQDIAFGLWGSLNCDSQQNASDWLSMLYQCANADPVWSGFTLKSIARSEVPMVANGAIYTPPTCSGPVLTLRESDLVGSGSDPLVTVTRKAQVDANNVIRAQFFDRNADYNQSFASQPLAGATALYGPRVQSPKMLQAVQDPIVAAMILGIEARRQSLLRNVYKSVAKAGFLMMEAGDLIAINESLLGITNLAIRLTKVTENDNLELEIEADPFVYGCNAPVSLPATSAAAPPPAPAGANPGSVNTPIFFEPVTRLSGQANQGQLWIPVSGSSPNYGGCAVMISTDGGASYNLAGQITGSAITGTVSSDWPSATDPDTTNDLLVNLSESLGALESFSVGDEDNFTFPCYVAGGLACIPYELMTYAIASLTGVNQYRLEATGGGTNHLRRAVFSCPQPALGVDHPAGSRFAFLNPNGMGIFKISFDPTWIGKTIFFKFLAVNTHGGNMQALADATAYSYTPTGCPAQIQNPNNNYVNTPAVILSQPSNTQVDMAQVSVQFPSNAVNYNARTFTIPDPGGTPAVWYVTIYDPGQIGDTGTQTNLTAFIEATTAKVGVPGYTYMGFIQATDPITDPRNVAGPGGWPVPQSFLVTP
jgi:hypothetical protein